MLKFDCCRTGDADTEESRCCWYCWCCCCWHCCCWLTWGWTRSSSLTNYCLNFSHLTNLGYFSCNSSVYCGSWATLSPKPCLTRMRFQPTKRFSCRTRTSRRCNFKIWTHFSCTAARGTVKNRWNRTDTREFAQSNNNKSFQGHRHTGSWWEK